MLQITLNNGLECILFQGCHDLLQFDINLAYVIFYHTLNRDYPLVCGGGNQRT